MPRGYRSAWNSAVKILSKLFQEVTDDKCVSCIEFLQLGLLHLPFKYFTTQC